MSITRDAQQISAALSPGFLQEKNREVDFLNQIPTKVYSTASFLAAELRLQQWATMQYNCKHPQEVSVHVHAYTNDSCPTRA